MSGDRIEGSLAPTMAPTHGDHLDASGEGSANGFGECDLSELPGGGIGAGAPTKAEKKKKDKVNQYLCIE